MSNWKRLTETEKKVIRMLAEGHARKVVAANLALSVKTVDHHTANVYRKLAVNDLVTVLRKLYVFTEVEPGNGKEGGKTHLDALNGNATRLCKYCGVPFTPTRPWQVFDDGKCRAAYHATGRAGRLETAPRSR